MVKRGSGRVRTVCTSFRPDGSLHVEPDRVRVKAGDRVRWVTVVRDAKVQVEFKTRRGPFVGEERVLKGVRSLLQAQVLSPPVKVDPGLKPRETKSYKYTAILSVGKCIFKLDPDVEVQG
ncbi:MAG: hypothetical protein NEA02_11135 [Thermoanaerobaculia bacterium]|nr:hypothetical protein [Thermoanaerobaculia bacterium]